MAVKVTLGGELLFPSDYLSAVEFKGRDVTLTVKTVSLDELVMVGGAKKKKPVLTFVETKKKLVLNKTNAKSICAMYGGEAKAWVGKRITFYPTKAPFGREIVDAIRVREGVQHNGDRLAPPAPIQQPAEEPDSIPFGNGDEQDAESREHAALNFADRCRELMMRATSPAEIDAIIDDISTNETWLGTNLAGNLRNEMRIALAGMKALAGK